MLARRKRGSGLAFLENGFSIYSKKNPTGRLIVTEDGPEQGLDAKAIEELAHDLFAR